MLESYNLDIILKVTTKTAVKYTQGEMRKELKHFTTENQLNRKEVSNAGNESQTSYIENKQHIGRCKSNHINNYIKCEWNKQIKGRNYQSV